MDLTTLLILGGLAYYFYTNYGKTGNGGNGDDGGSGGGKPGTYDGGGYFPTSKQSPAEQYISITPKVVLNEVTGNEWTGYIDWYIKNTSKNVDFVITKICSNLAILEYFTFWIPGNKDRVRRLDAGTEIVIRSTWQGRRWYLAGDTMAKDAIKEKLRSELDKEFPIVLCDVRVWLQGANGSSNFYDFLNCKGTALLESGTLKLVSPQGENAKNWEIADLGADYDAMTPGARFEDDPY